MRSKNTETTKNVVEFFESKWASRYMNIYGPVTELARVFIVASAAAVDAEIVVELTGDDDVTVDEIKSNRIESNKPKKIT